MGRKPIGEVDTDMMAMSTMAENQKEHELTVQEINDLYSDGKAYDVFRIQEEIQFYQDKAGEALIEIGKRLILVKANEEHGGFLKTLENTSMSLRSARYAMSAARKFSNVQSIAHLGKTKMIALSVLDDNDIQEIEDLKEYAGHSIDELDQMSTRALKELIKKEREEKQEIKNAEQKRIEALEKVVANKEAKITELELENAHRVPPTKAELAQKELKELEPTFNGFLFGAKKRIKEATDLLDNAMLIEGVSKEQLDAFVSEFTEDLEALESLRYDLEQVVDNLYPKKKED